MYKPLASSRYVLATLAALGGAAARVVLNSLFGFTFPFLTFYPAVIMTAWFGGFWPGVACTVLSAGAAKYLWLEPVHTLRILNVGDGVALGIFIAVGGTICVISDRLRRRQHHERQLREHAIASGREVIVLKDRLAIELADMTRLHELTARLLKEDDLDQALHHILDDAVRLLNADNGYLQLVEPDGKARRIAAQIGFPQTLRAQFEVAPEGASLGTLTIESRERVIIEDACAHPRFSSVASVCAAHGFISGQATPLFSNTGAIVGLLATHSLRPHRPSERELRMLDLRVRLAERLLDRSRLVEREQTARASAEAANRAKDEFLAIVSHELRAPLNAVLGWAEMLRNGVLDERRRERAVEVIYTNARRQRELIDELLDVGRIMSGKVRLERAPVDLSALLRVAVEVVQPAADAKHIQLSVETEHAPGSFYGDQERLHQVVGNLLSNAIKFTPEGGMVQAALSRRNGLIEIAVSDSGIGIPRDFLPYVFEPFVQADRSSTRRHGGLGLGLSIVRHLVQAHAGSVTVESAGEGRGSVFTIRLPIVAVYPASAEARGPSPRPHLSGDGAGTVLEGITTLLVDDDDDSRGSGLGVS